MSSSSGKNLVLTDADFDGERLKKAGLVLVDFWATWCAPCRAMRPVLDKLAPHFPLLEIGEVNADENLEVGVALQVRGLPTFVLFKDGIKVGQIVGAVSLDKMRAFIQSCTLDSV